MPLIAPSQKATHGGWRPGAGRPVRTDWQDDFLALLATKGGVYACADEVGVDYNTVLHERNRNPHFAHAYQEAEGRFADKQERSLDDISTGVTEANPVGAIVLLKKYRPAEYIERHAILNLSANIEDMDPEAQRILAAEMFGSLTQASRQALSAVPRTVELANAPSPNP